MNNRNASGICFVRSPIVSSSKWATVIVGEMS